MSEIAPGNGTFFDKVEDVYTDPYITAVFAEMHVYNQLLSSEPVSEAEINEIMNELDGKWSMLLQKDGVITGRLGFLPDEYERGELVWSYYEDLDVRFNGVIPVPIAQTIGSDGIERSTYELQLQVMKESIIADADSSLIIQTGRARVDELATIEFPQMMSHERALRWLEYYHQDTLELIDIALLNPGIEECEQVKRLVGADIDLMASYRGDEGLCRRSVQALDAYANSLISFDTEMPYDLIAQGDCWIVKDGECLPAEIPEPETILCGVDRMAWISTHDDEYTLKPHIAVRALVPDKDSPAVFLLVPIDAIQQFRSHRFAYFGGYDT